MKRFEAVIMICCRVECTGLNFPLDA